MTLLALALGLLVGFVLGLLGGGGSILAVPVFLYVLHVETKSAIAMSLAVVGLSAFVGFLTHWRHRNVELRVAVPFGLCAMVSAFFTARLTHLVPTTVQLTLFAIFAFAAAVAMLRDAARPDRSDSATTNTERARFSPKLIPQAVGVGVLTSLIGAGGGFVIVPALVLMANVPIKPAVGSSLLIITLNALSGFVGHIGRVPIDWPLIGSFSVTAAIGAIAGTLLHRQVPQRRVKQAFAILILVLGAYLIAQRTLFARHNTQPAQQQSS
ncbi:MAG TPA: sulfite exporter TauE/SafE family protein [Gemmatimonadaceae bacterium]|jgi:hypothetical protein